MKVLLTGAFGNVGSSTLEALLKQGHQVRCFDIKTPNNLRLARKYRGRTEIIWGDLRKYEDVRSAVEGQDIVVHLAFIIPKLSHTGKDCEAHPQWAREINIGGTSHVIQAIQAQPSPAKLIFSSSLHVYGRTLHQSPCRQVGDPVVVTDHYTEHKIECERLIRESGLQWSIVRLAAVLPLSLRLDPEMFEIPLHNRMEFVYTHDVGLAIANAIRTPEVWGQVWHIGGGPSCQYTYGQIVQTIMTSMGIGMLPKEAFGPIPFPTDWLDTTESQRVLQYQQHTLDDFAREMVKQLGWRRVAIPLFRPLVRAWLLRRSNYWQQYKAKRALLPWQGKLALVTGASSGIGAATARILAQRGLKVILVARRQDRLEQLAADIRTHGGEAEWLVTDLAQENAAVTLYQEIRQRFGSIDLLVNNAGFAWYGYAAEMPWSIAQEMMQVNLLTPLRMTLLYLKEMRERKQGMIVNIGSIAGDIPSQGVALYSATKSFLSGWSTSIFRELKGSRVQFCLVKPGPVQTEFFDSAPAQEAGMCIPAQGLACRVEVVAQRIASLLLRPRRVLYVPRYLAIVPWLELIFGRLMDWMGPALLRRDLKTVRRVS